MSGGGRAAPDVSRDLENPKIVRKNWKTFRLPGFPVTVSSNEAQHFLI